MRYLGWLFKLILFFVLLGFAVRNSDIVVLHYYFGYEWHAPLVFILMVFFVAGAIIGLLAGLTHIFRQRRQIATLKRELQKNQNISAVEEIQPPTTAEAL